MPLLGLLLAAQLSGPVGDDAAREAVEHLRTLVSIDTTNPPGNELAAARAVARILEREKIPYQIVETAPGRGGVIARLTGNERKRPLLLLAHLDVVGAVASEWSAPPFQLTERDGYFFGRGTLDDKHHAAVFLEIVLLLHRAKVPLERDVILALTPDEEATAEFGLTAVLKARPELISDAEIALNEGGRARTEGEKLNAHFLQVGEKLYRTFRLEARSPGGHSSVPHADNAIVRLARAIERIGALALPPRIGPLQRAVLEAKARDASPADARALLAAARARGAVPADALRLISKIPDYNADVRTTCVPTLVSGGTVENALPTRAEAHVNCRILPEDDPADVERRLREAIADPRVELKATDAEPASPPSPIEGPVWEAFRAIAAERSPGVPVAPLVSPSATDARILRRMGIHTYGCEPFPVNDDDASRPHGPDERIPVAAFRAGLEFLHDLVLELAAPETRRASRPRAPYRPAALAEVVTLAELALSPDGGELAFTSDQSGAVELWTIPLAGGAPTGPAVQVTRAGEHVQGLSWSSDGSRLAFGMDRGGDERPDVWIYRRGGRAERLLRTPTAESGVRFSPDARSIAYAADPRRPFRFDLQVLDLGTRRARTLTKEPFNVLALVWSQDGRTIAATVTPDDQSGALLLVDVATGTSRRVAAPVTGGIVWPIAALPRSRLLARATNAAGFLQLAEVDLASGAIRLVGPAEWDVDDARVVEDETIVYTRNVHGASEVAIARGLEGAPRVISAEGWVSDLDIDRAAKTVVFLREATHHPPEIVAVDVASGRSSALVPAALGEVSLDALARGERRVFESFDHEKIDAFVIPPRTPRLGTPPPAVVRVHGGPTLQRRDWFEFRDQALAEAGFLVIAPNYRGSAGYGRRFADLNNKDWGGGDLKDIEAVVDALAREGRIDPKRVGITGESFGGYLALRALTDEPSRWAAAVEMFGMADLEVDYELTADRFGTWYETEMGTPKTHGALFRDRSPIHALDRIRAPLLVFQGLNDSNVPKKESDQVVERLKKRAHPVEYVVYRDEGHGFTRRKNRIDCVEKTVDFFVRHLR